MIEDSLELINEEDIFSCKVDDGQLTLDKDVINDTCKEYFESFPFDIQPGQLERGKEKVRFDQNSLLVDLPST